ncbi:MAG: hypothetical protein SFT91_00585 [Rickettsiaceae bacterium]|nr:hypothetical protein [Rickettsiaceae bacterium]
MKKVFNSLLLIPALIIVLFASFNAFAKPNISGDYHCKGYDPFTKANYEGGLKITLAKNTYQFVWDLDYKQSRILFSGTGFVQGNQVSVAFASNEDPKYAGIQLYKIMPDKSLTGKWAIIGKDITTTETCVPVQKADNSSDSKSSKE